MGGFAAAIDWTGSVDDEGFARMTAGVEHRGPAGVRTATFGSASLCEARLLRDGTGEWDIATDGDLTIVGDIRLWDTDALIEMAGSHTAPATDRDLLLAAYAAAGPAMMGHVDGDFAFAIWDDDEQNLFAARDRFGTKPLFYSTTPTGIRLGSEARRVACSVDGRPTPDDLVVARFLNGRFDYDERTFFAGVSRVMPAQTLIATSQGTRRHTYWTLPSGTAVRDTRDGVATRFRESLVGAVHRRIGGAHRTISHLSGGLDSSAVTASAALLTDRDLEPETFVTVSAVFPGSEADESELIAEVVAMQPFDHREFVPRVGPIDWYEADMEATGTPIAHHVRDLTARVREIAVEEDADLVLTGNGGDDVVNDGWVLAALLRRGSWKKWFDATQRIRAGSSKAANMRAVSSVAYALPGWAKAPLRRLRPKGEEGRTAPISDTLRDTLGAASPVAPAPAPRSMADSIAGGLRSGRRLVLLEMQEAMFAVNGVEVSHPFLDRRLIEFVASIDPADRPLTDANKALIRAGFDGLLPDSVLGRRTKTVGNTLIAGAITEQGAEFARRYPAVSGSEEQYLDSSEYSDRLVQFGSSTPSLLESLQLWNSWSLLLWLETVVESDGETTGRDGEPKPR